jgi:hypothetical protein
VSYLCHNDDDYGSTPDMIAAALNIVTHLHCLGSYVVFVQAGRVIYDISLCDIHREIDHLEEKRWFTSLHRAQLLALAGRSFKPSSQPGGP